MIKEEDILISMFGRESHFSVPEGYFQNITQTVMDRLPEEEVRVLEMHSSFLHRLPVRKIAAVVGALFVITGTAFYVSSSSRNTTTSMAHVEKNVPVVETADDGCYGTFDEVADYTMLDNEQIYSSLMAENYKN